jgi:hypothetical protein
VVLAAVSATLIAAGLITALNSPIAGQAIASPTAMLHYCKTSTIASNSTLPTSDADWRLLAAFDDHSGLRTLVAAAGGGVVLCEWGPRVSTFESSHGRPPQCPDPPAPMYGVDSVICGAIGGDSVIAGEVSRHVAALRVTFPDGRTLFARLGGGCFTFLDPTGTALDDLTGRRDVRIQAIDATGAVLYDGPLE